VSESLFSPSWYRVAELKPRLRKHAEFSKHLYRGQVWFVLQDRSSGRHHRLSPVAQRIVSLMDGKRTMKDIFQVNLEELGDDALTQDELIRLFAQLHGSDLLLCDVTPDSRDFLRRFEQQKTMKWRQWLLSPLSQRFPLFDPEAFLQHWLFLVKPLYSALGVGIWSVTVGVAILLGAMHWSELTENITDQVLAPTNLVALFIIYPLVKTLHELGHAFTTKIWGGEVHEMGIMLLVFIPVPYVDASYASAFNNKYKRMAAGAAGIIVEMFLAAIALFVWLNVEPGIIRAAAYNVIVIGSVSTLLFNGNPLLRFDGYYVFSDFLEIPNLGARSNNYLGYLIQRYLFGSKNARSPALAAGEKVWFSFYGIASSCYRIFIAFSLILYVAGKFFFVGVIIALWSAFSMLVLPIYKSIVFLATGSGLAQQRSRAIATTAGVISVFFVVFFVIPFPLYTHTEGVVWLPEQAQVRSATDGFVKQFLTKPKSRVQTGQPLVEIEDPFLLTQLEVQQHRLEELKSRYTAELAEDFNRAQLTKEEIEQVQAELERLQVRVDDQQIASRANGIFIVPRAEDLPDRFVRHGDLVGYVVDPPISTVRAVVRQDDIGLIRQRIKKVNVRLAGRVAEQFDAVIEREVPSATKELPGPALSSFGGGEIPVDPSDNKGNLAFEPVFLVDLKLPKSVGVETLGARAYIRFDHGAEPLFRQFYRRARQLFLRRFSI
jgi:putative peptide zinc metalloprotease protein